MGSLTTNLLQVYCWLCASEKNLEDRTKRDEAMTSMVAYLLEHPGHHQNHYLPLE